MKKITFLSILLSISGAVFSQFVSPGTGVTYGLSDLVTASPTTFTFDNGVYTILDNVEISVNDKLEITENTTVKITAGKQITIKGEFIVNAPDLVTFTRVNEGEFFKGFRFEESSDVNIKNALITYGGGLQVLTPSFEMSDSEVSFNNSGSSTSAAVGFSRGNPVVRNSKFIKNSMPAFSSGGNQVVGAIIEGNYLEGNSVSNGNRPQINMGPGSVDSVRIIGNTVIGDRTLTRVGGIAVSSLLGTQSLFVIENNIVKDNRYGISITGPNGYGRITGNIIEDNNTENNPTLGGSGIAIQAAVLSTYVYITNNEIRRNLWGVTAINKALVNLGSDDPDYLNPGGNVFSENGNSGFISAFYNNTSNVQDAMFNCWVEGQYNLTLEEVEEVVTHVNDIETLGLVNFEGFECIDPSLAVNKETVNFEMYPNPSNGTFTVLVDQNASFEIINSLGQNVQVGNLNAGANLISTTLTTGVYFVNVTTGKAVAMHKMIIK